jgi:MFS family permease
LLPPKPRTAMILALLWGGALTVFSLANAYWFALGFLMAAGFLELSFNAMAQSLVQLDAPPDKRGRVIGLFNMASLGLKTFSGISVGLIGSLIGIHWSLAASALVAMLVAAALLVLP